jgi:chemotaxis protein methyltransferase CheR
VTAIDDVARVVSRETGIKLDAPHRAALLGALDRISPGSDPAWFLRELHEPARGPELLAQLIDEMTVKETFFLRDAVQLQQIAWHLILEQARSSGADVIRVWCAGCATGEEAYSLALLAAEAFAPTRAPVSILATDISRTALEAAREATYRPRAVRELDVPLRRRYFAEAGGERLVVGERLRAHVSLLHHNLVHDPPPPPGENSFHLVLCRNVLIYFDSNTVERVLERLRQALAPGGTLVLGAADALCANARRPASLVAGGPAPPRRPPPLGARPRPERAVRNDATDRARRPAVIAPDALDEVASFLGGLAELERGEAMAAVDSFRRALYADPGFGLAAFELGRAHDALGNEDAAYRAYARAVRLLDAVAERHEPLFEQVDPADVAAAARARLDALVSVGLGVRG